MSAGSEILIQIGDHRLQVAEVPIKVRYDIENTYSQHPVSHGVSVLMNIVKLVSCRRPLFFFGILGFLLTVLGIGLEIYTFSEHYRTNQFHYILFTVGMSSLMLGLLLATAGIILFTLIELLKGQGIRTVNTSASTRAATSPLPASPESNR
jgi:hypothetical protein